MSPLPKRKNNSEDDDWVYNQEFIDSVLESKKEVEKSLQSGKKLNSLDNLLEKFRKEDAKKIQD